MEFELEPSATTVTVVCPFEVESGVEGVIPVLVVEAEEDEAVWELNLAGSKV